MVSNRKRSGKHTLSAPLHQAIDTPPEILCLYGLIIFIETLAWFSFVAFCLLGKRTRERFSAASHWIERVTGGILVGLRAKLFLMA